VGWSVSESLATPLVSTTLRNAIEARRPDTKSLLHHSDRGSKYTSDDYQQTLRTLNITCSMSRTGCCYDNDRTLIVRSLLTCFASEQGRPDWGFGVST
jgi:putative transposase